MRWALVLLAILLFGCTRTIYVPVECPPPPVVEKPIYDPIDMTATPPEQMRSIVGLFGQCLEYSENLETVLKEYRK